MILFKKDWDKYPTATVHIRTKNTSFLEFAKKLKLMGRKNYLFPLALINPLLIDVDPHDENLSRETKAMILEEVKINPWYFFREVARVPAKASSNPRYFEANRGNIALIWNYFNHITTLLIQPRQTGKSLTSYLLHTGLLSFWSKNSTITLLTKDDTLRTSSIEQIKDCMAALPNYLRLRTKRDSNNSFSIEIGLRNNKLVTAVGQSSEKAAYNVLRGLTTPTRHVDEFGYVRNIHITLSPYLAAGSAANDEAEESGNPYGTILTTTPAYRNSKEGEFAYNKYSEGLKWSEEFYDLKDRKELEEVLDKNSRSGIMVLEFNHRQLGKTDDWLRRKIKDAQSEGEDAEADYLLIWPLGSGATPIDKKLIKKLNSSAMDPLFTDVLSKGFVINWYKEEKYVNEVLRNQAMIVGLDPSEGFGKDEMGLVIRDIRTGEVLGAGAYNNFNINEFSIFIFDFLTKFKKAVMIVERKSTGSSLMDNVSVMLENIGEDPFKRFFNWVVQEYDINISRYEEVAFAKQKQGLYNRFRKHFGYATAGSGKATREKIYGENVIASLKFTGSVARDKAIIRQISDLKIKNGRLDHDNNKHDDVAIAWLLGYWFLTNVKNSEYYGISPNSILSRVTENDPNIEKTLKEDSKEIEMRGIRNKISELFEELEATRDEIKTVYIVNKIRALSKRIGDDMRTSMNSEAMIREVLNNKLKEAV